MALILVDDKPLHAAANQDASAPITNRPTFDGHLDERPKPIADESETTDGAFSRRSCGLRAPDASLQFQQPCPKVWLAEFKNMGTIYAPESLPNDTTIKLIGYTVLFKGILAGFIGTVALSAMMIVKSIMGILPELDPVGMLAEMLGGSMVLGWIMHFLIGSVAWGGGFALIHNSLPTHNSVKKGVIFGVGAWLIMMLVVMPMAGEGIFGLVIGIAAPVMTFVLHVVFGAVMGFAYNKQISTAQPVG